MEAAKTSDAVPFGTQQRVISKTRKYLDVIGSPGRYPSLDGLRGLAIIAVLLRHAVHSWHQSLDSPFWNFWHNGWLGVELFFTLSGFLIIHHLISWWPSNDLTQFLRAYFSKRALRIIPIYVCALLIGGLGVIPFYETPEPVTKKVIAWHALFIQEYFYSTIAVPLWSIAVEEKFYIAAPIIVFFAMTPVKGRLFRLAGTFIFAVLAIKMTAILTTPPNSYSQYFWQYRAPFHYAIINMFPGVAVALLIHLLPSPIPSKSILQRMSLIAAALLGALLLPSNLHETERWLAVDITALLCSICFATLIYCGVYSGLIGLSFFESRFLRFFARTSYPLYAVHIMFVPLSTNLTNSLHITSLSLNFCTFFSIYICLSFAAAIILHLLVEKPFLRLKQTVPYKSSIPSPSPTH